MIDPDRHDIRTIRREALARRLFVALFVALGLIVLAAQARADQGTGAPSQSVTTHPSEALLSAVAACIQANVSAADLPEVDPTEALLVGLTWADALDQIVSSDMAEMIVEDRSWLDATIAEMFEETSYWVGEDVRDDHYRFLTGPEGWMIAAMVINDQDDDDFNGYAKCYFWHEELLPDQIAWVSQWDFVDPETVQPGAVEPRLWTIRETTISAETAFSDSSLDLFAMALEPDVIADAPRTILVITRTQDEYEVPE